MIMLLIDAVILISLLKVVNQDDDVSFGTAILFALVASIAMAVLVYFLSSALGLIGVLLATLIAAVGTGIAVAAIFGAVLQRSLIIGGGFVVLHLAASFGIQALLS